MNKKKNYLELLKKVLNDQLELENNTIYSNDGCTNISIIKSVYDNNFLLALSYQKEIDDAIREYVPNLSYSRINELGYSLIVKNSNSKSGVININLLENSFSCEQIKNKNIRLQELLKEKRFYLEQFYFNEIKKEINSFYNIETCNPYFGILLMDRFNINLLGKNLINGYGNDLLLQYKIIEDSFNCNFSFNKEKEKDDLYFIGHKMFDYVLVNYNNLPTHIKDEAIEKTERIKYLELK